MLPVRRRLCGGRQNLWGAGRAVQGRDSWCIVGLTLGIMVSLSGVRLLGPIFEFGGAEASFQQAVFQFTDVILTAGLIAGGSATIHELMALVDDFLKTSRKRAKQS